MVALTPIAPRRNIDVDVMAETMQYDHLIGGATDIVIDRSQHHLYPIGIIYNTLSGRNYTVII